MSEKRKKKILILCIDRDNDVGLKGGVQTPIIGRSSVIDAANKLLLSDPEDADGNTMFAAVKLYDELRGSSEDEYEVAVVTGSEKGGVAADQKMLNELKEILSIFRANGLILVTDGYSDEEIIPILASHNIPILSIRHVVVKHSESVEETYAILGKYLKMLWSEQPYRTYFVAIPGIIIALFGILMFLDLTGEAIAFSLIIAGIAMVIKGFGIDDYLYSLSRAPFSEYIRLATYVISLISLSVGIYVSYRSIATLPIFEEILNNPTLMIKYGATISAAFLPPFLLTILVTVFIYVLGLSLYSFVTERYYRIIRYLIILEATMIIFIAGNEATKVLVNPAYGFSNLIIYISIGLLVLSITIIIVYVLARRRRPEIEA